MLEQGYAEETGVGFGARLIHRTNPESPFYDPSASPEDILESAVRSSRARGKYLGNIISIDKFHGSRKYPVSPISTRDGGIVMQFSIGDPPLLTYAIPDTGSSTVWLQCLPCDVCYNQSVPIYAPYGSTTYARVDCNHTDCAIALGGQKPNDCKEPYLTCTFEVEYEDGTKSSGEIVSDSLQFDVDRKGFGEVFWLNNTLLGCGFNNTLHEGADPTVPHAPGVFGLSNQTGSLIRQLNLGLFSFCISENDVNNSQIRFGLAAAISGQVTTELAPLNQNGWYFFKNVDGIYLDGIKLKGYPEWVFQFVEGGIGGLMIDSGTTFTALYPVVFDLLVKSVNETIYLKTNLIPEKDASSMNWELCYRADSLLPSHPPEIEFRFSDTLEGMPYRYENFWLNNYEGQICLAIDRGPYSASIIGQKQLDGVNVAFDLLVNKVTFRSDFVCPHFDS